MALHWQGLVPGSPSNRCLKGYHVRGCGMSVSDRNIHRSDGPVLLLAGPGTGKTHQLALRIKFLVEEKNVAPGQISVITFTAAAAANMRARISDATRPELFLDSARQPGRICTMHSLGLSIIRENAGLLSLPDLPSVVHSDFARSILLGDAAQLAGYGRDAARDTAKCRQYGDCRRDGSPKCTICDSYRQILTACRAIDYDDQILLACRLLGEQSGLAVKYRAQSLHLLVDEYQDINAGQFELIKALGEGQTKGLFVVGDDDQSIYSWRGGSPEFIRNFKKHFGTAAQVLPLRTSRRCHRNILEGALAVVKGYDKHRLDKGKIRHVSPDGPLLHVHSVASEKAEAAVVRRVITDALPSREVLVLVPTRRHATLITEQLRRARVAYIAPEPPPGMGLPLLERLAAWLRDEKDNLALRECIEAIAGSSTSPIPSKRVKKAEKREQREENYREIGQLWGAVLKNRRSLWAVLAATEGAQEGITAFVRRQCTDLRQCYAEGHVADLLQHAAQSLEPWKKADALLEEVETWVARFARSSDAGSEAQVRVMTFQGAKGLEADVVCVVGLEEGTLPRDGASCEELAEQSRLMYVSMTRARTDLHLFHARTRSGAVSFKQIHGKGGPHTLQHSCFLDAIPGDCRMDEYHPAKRQ